VPIEDLYLSVLTLGEVRRRIALLSRREQTRTGFCLLIDAEAAEEWGRMNVLDPISIVDGLMAANVRNMIFVTRNTADAARPVRRFRVKEPRGPRYLHQR
jgi:predicted nucleic acid-binding protein